MEIIIIFDDKIVDIIDWSRDESLSDLLYKCGINVFNFKLFS